MEDELMSQEKVAKYKEDKANRKKIMKREKRAKILRNSALVLVFAAAIGWVGYSGVISYLDTIPRDSVEVDYTAVSDYLSNLSADTE
jgi:hypothetical protein